MHRSSFIAVFLAALPMQGALAAGFAVREQSADAMSTAYAGSAATATDASFLAFNPAAAATPEGGGDASLSAVAILPTSSAEFDSALTSAGTPTGGNRLPSSFIRNAIVPNISLRQRVSERWSFGLSVSVPWGLSTLYPTTYSGRYYGLDTKLQATNISPVVAFDITPNIVVAGGFQAQYAKGTLTSAIDIGTLGVLSGIPGSVPGAMDGSARINAHSWAYGYVLGARAVLPDDWTLGLSYRSAVHHTLKGPLTFTYDSAGLGAAINAATGLFSNTSQRTKLNTPETVEFGVRKQLDDRWTALLEVSWTGWSAFRSLNVIAANPAQPNDLTDAKWNDAWMASLGTQFEATEDWLLRAGVAYDASPIPDSTLGPRIPDADRYWISTGATYHASSFTDIKLTLSHLFNDTRDITQNPGQPGNAFRGALAGSTASGVNVVGLQIDYHWH